MGKYFGTDGFRGEANKALTAEKAFQVAKPQILNSDYAEEKIMPKILIDAYKIPISSIFSA